MGRRMSGKMSPKTKHAPHCTSVAKSGKCKCMSPAVRWPLSWEQGQLLRDIKNDKSIDKRVRTLQALIRKGLVERSKDHSCGWYLTTDGFIRWGGMR